MSCCAILCYLLLFVAIVCYSPSLCVVIWCNFVFFWCSSANLGFHGWKYQKCEPLQCTANFELPGKYGVTQASEERTSSKLLARRQAANFELPKTFPKSFRANKTKSNFQYVLDSTFRPLSASLMMRQLVSSKESNPLHKQVPGFSRLVPAGRMLWIGFRAGPWIFFLYQKLYP